MKKYIFLIFSFISIITTWYLSLLPLNWNSQADISNLYTTSITPAWFTFSIWSLIYFSWLFLWFYLISNKTKIKSKNIYLLIAAQLTSAFWLFPWHYNYVWISIIVMIALLWILSYLTINRTKNKIFQGVSDLFFWWILIATIVNFHTYLLYADLYTSPLVFWVISLIVWAIINLVIIRKYNTVIPSLVFIWSLIWITSKQTDVIVWTSYFVWVVTLAMTINNILKTKKIPWL